MSTYLDRGNIALNCKHVITRYYDTKLLGLDLSISSDISSVQQGRANTSLELEYYIVWPVAEDT